jgi:hypothetical protein
MRSAPIGASGGQPRISTSFCKPSDFPRILTHFGILGYTIEVEDDYWLGKVFKGEIFRFFGCSRLGETIDRFKVSAVVHGHAHRGCYEGRTARGVPVYNVAFPIQKSTGRPYALIKI